MDSSSDDDDVPDMRKHMDDDDESEEEEKKKPAKKGNKRFGDRKHSSSDRFCNGFLCEIEASQLLPLVLFYSCNMPVYASQQVLVSHARTKH